MEDNKKKAFDFAQDTTKQLITLSTAILTLTITFGEKFKLDLKANDHTLIIVAWFAFLVSIVMGLLALMTMTGALAKDTSTTPADVYAKNTRIMSGLQVLAFLAGIFLTLLFGKTLIDAPLLPTAPHAMATVFVSSLV